MILSDLDLLAFIESGDITIDPFKPEFVKPGSYSFTLGNLLLRPRFQGVVEIDKPETFQYEEVWMTDAGYDLQPGEFILGQTAEKVSLSNRLACFSDGRTLLARLGIQVVLNSTFIEPGQTESQETLEIKNSGPAPVRLYPGMKVCKGIFVLLHTPSARKYADFGTYAHQSSPRPKVEPML
jgi:dCTP deaminase